MRRSTTAIPVATMAAAFLLLFGVWLGTAAASDHQAAGSASDETQSAASVDVEVPALPFADNPDPEACGIPQRWGEDEAAWLTGFYEGELIQPVVFLYDSHLRREVVGQAPSGSEVRVILFQDNPVLNYFMVEVTHDDGTVEQGWVPAAFLTFEDAQTQTPG